MSDTVTFQPGPMPRGLAPAPEFTVPRPVSRSAGGRFGIEAPVTTGPVYLGGGSALPAPAATGTDGLAITSFLLSLVGLSLLGVIFGHLALGRIGRTGRSGRGLAVTGLVLGYLSMAAAAAFLAMGGLASVLAVVTG